MTFSTMEDTPRCNPVVVYFWIDSCEILYYGVLEVLTLFHGQHLK